MTLCAGICYATQMGKNGQATYCTVRLSKKILQFRSYANLLETLLHEMIHAHLFVSKTRYERNDGVDGHGPDFIAKMVQINDTTGLNLSVYHQFMDEVDVNREHVWLCNGKCARKPPFYGVVKRARNMPPGNNDWWFKKHQAECAGQFIKVCEPKEMQKQ